MEPGVSDGGGPVMSPVDVAEESSVTRARATTFLMIGVAALAFTAPWVKLANFEPATSAILRVGLALIVLLPFAFRERAKIGSVNKTGVVLALVAGFFLGIDFTAWNYSIFFVGSGVASVLLNLQIIILPAMAVIFDGYRPRKRYYFLVPIMIFGVILTGGVLDSAPSKGPTDVYGMDIAILGTLLGATSGVCYGIYLYMSRKSSTLNPGRIVQPMAITCAAQLIAPTLFLLLFSSRGFDVSNGVLVDGDLPFNPETVVGDAIGGMSWVWIIVLAVLGQAMAWTFVQFGSVRLDTTLVAGLLLLSPVATVALISPLLFGEVPSLLQVLGVVVVLGAVAYQNDLHQAIFRRKRRADATADPIGRPL